jgi:apolipoprotein N-acyltransferase
VSPARRFRAPDRHALARGAAALGCGAAAALAHPPFGLLPGLLGYAALAWLAGRAPSAWSAFRLGWLAGFSYFLISCWWVAEAFLVNPAQAWMAPFAAALLPAGVAVFWAAPLGLFRRLAPEGLGRVLVFPALFVLFEWLRGHVLTGFPWNPAGASWGAGSPLSQTAALVGVYGLSLLTLVGLCAPLALVQPGPRKARAGVALAGLALLGGLWLGGAWRLDHAEVQPGPTLLRIVQADVKQETKWSPEAYQGIVRRYINLTARPGAATPDVVIWPEGALPALANDVFAPGAPEAEAMARALLPGQTLLVGLGRAAAGPDGEVRYHNALFALRDEGGVGLRIAAIYDKHRLVPFGEYLPLGDLMSRTGLRSLVHVPADFTPGPRPGPIDIPGVAAVQPLICYESLYPGFTPGGGARPAWIVNVSNDAWFGRSSGPLQHLNLASFRAIETGLPIVRSTPTGVSAVIDPWGRVVEGARLDSGESGVIDARLPLPAAATPYGRFGDWLWLPLWLAAMAPLAAGGPGRALRARLRRTTGESSAA